MRLSTHRLNMSVKQSPLLLGLIIALAYVIAGRFGLLLAVPPGYATAIFPPAGIAVAAALIGGRSTLPWIFAGSGILNLWVGLSVEHQHVALLITLAVAIAAASTLQAAFGAAALRRFISYPMPLDNPRDIARFFLIAPVACLTSATLSLSAMTAAGAIDLAQLAPNWFSWWIGDTLGVLLFLPLVMTLAGEPRSLWRSRTRPVAVPMLLFFALFVAIFVRTRAWERDQSLADFQLLSQSFEDKLQFELSAQQGFLQQLSASWSNPAPVGAEQFATLTSHILQRFPAIQAIEWVPRVAAADRAQFEAAQRRNDAGFDIRDRAPNGRMVRAGDRAFYDPVTYLQPLRGNEAALGFDLASDPARAAAIDSTMRTHAMAATAPVRLVQHPNDPTGILLSLAVPPGPAGSGVLLIVLRMDKFVGALLGPTARILDVQIIDQAAHQPLFDPLPIGINALQDQPIAFGGRTYIIRTAPTALYSMRHQRWQSWTVLVVGVLSTSLLGALLMLSTGERNRFARLLSQRTRERDRIWQVSEDLLGVGNFDGYFLSVNPAWTHTLGWSEDEIRALHVDDLRHPDDAAISNEGRRRLAQGAGTVRMENRFRHKDGSYRWIYWTITAEQGLIYLIGRDVTADKEAAQAHRETEEQLRQLQKTEAIGQLTGGIAHDFNNLLTIIIGNLELLERSLTDAPAKVARSVKSAMSGATRAAALTQRLLAYAQRQPLRPTAVDLNELVAGMGELISRTQGETIHCEFMLGQDLPLCFCDANQLETALLNLAINARDAMPNGGRLRIATMTLQLDATAAAGRNMAAGPYVMLAVSDTGTGMSRETQDRAFEPFFTTKEMGKGTGLGLSMVYGFVRQSSGHIDIDSTPGAGTTLRILLPALATHAAAKTGHADSRPAAPDDSRGAGETILVTEDDAGVRGFVVEALRELNYHVLEANDAPSALALMARTEHRIDLLLTDVVMPGMNGRDLANRARSLAPSIRVLFMTGYSQNAFVHQGRLDPDIELIEKPFRSDGLARRVRAMLDNATEDALT